MDIWIVVMSVCVGIGVVMDVVMSVGIGVVMDVSVCGYWCGNGCVCVGIGVVMSIDIWI